MEPEWAETLATALNSHMNDRDWYYRAVPDDYTLKRGMEDLV